MSASLFPEDVEVRVIEYTPGKFAPVVRRGGVWEFKGGRVHYSHESAEAAKDEEVAFQKRFWSAQLENRTRAVVVGGIHYRLGKRSAATRADLRGSCGRTYHLRNLESGEVTSCSDLWVQGAIPDFALPLFPDSHEFVGDAS